MSINRRFESIMNFAQRGAEREMYERMQASRRPREASPPVTAASSCPHLPLNDEFRQRQQECHHPRQYEQGNHPPHLIVGHDPQCHYARDHEKHNNGDLHHQNHHQQQQYHHKARSLIQNGSRAFRATCAALYHRAREAYRQHRLEVAATPESCYCDICTRKERLRVFYQQLQAERAAEMMGSPTAVGRSGRPR